MRRSERIAAAGAVLENELDAAPGHDLERGDAARGALRGDAEQLQRRFRRFDAGKRGLDRARPRHQAQHRRGDDAERAFGADEKVFQVVAGVVLFQLVEIVHYPAVGQHHLDAEHVRARDAVRNRRRAAGIGREIAADGAGAFGWQELRIEPVDCGRGLARALQSDAGLAGDGVRGRIDLADAIHAVEREHDLVVQRNLPADQAGIAALRHDRRAGVVGEFQYRRNFGYRRRSQHHRRVALEHVAHLDQIRRLQVRVGDGEFLADDRGEAREERGVELFGLLTCGVQTWRLIEHRDRSRQTRSDPIDDSRANAAQARPSSGRGSA